LDLIRTEHIELPAIAVATLLLSLPGGGSVERRCFDRPGSSDDDPLLVRLLKDDLDAQFFRFSPGRGCVAGLQGSAEMHRVNRGQRRLAAEIGPRPGDPIADSRGGRRLGTPQPNDAQQEENAGQSRRVLHQGKTVQGANLASETGIRNGNLYSHSMVAGGLELMSSTTRLTPRTSFVMRLE